MRDQRNSTRKKLFLVRGLFAQFLSWLLLMPYPAIGAGTEVGALIQAGAQLGQNIVNERGQQMQQQFLAQQQVMQQQTFQRLLNPAAVPNDVFPNCADLPTIPPQFPGMCSPNYPIHSPMEMTTAQSFRDQLGETLDTWRTYQDEQVREPGKGASCLRRSQRRLQDTLTARLSTFRNTKEMLIHEAREFAVAAQGFLNEIKDENALLTGRAQDAGTKTQDQVDEEVRNRIAAKGNACNAVRTAAQFSGGLTRVKNQMMQDVVPAQRLIASKGNLEAQIREQARQIGNAMRSRGLGSIRGEDGIAGLLAQAGGSEPIGSLQGGVMAAVSDFEPRYRQLQNEFSEFATYMSNNAGITPSIDISTSNLKNMENTIQNMESTFRETYTRNCMRGGVRGISNKDILARISLPGVTNGTSLTSYRSEVNSILENNELTIDQKQRQIAALERRFKGRYVVRFERAFPDRNKSAGDPWSISEVLDYAEEACNDAFTSSRASQSVSGRLRNFTPAQILEQTVARMRQAQETVNNTIQQAEQRMLQRALNCQGIRYSETPGPGGCSEDKLNTSSANFCVSQSISCANSFNNCNQQIRQVHNEIEARKAQKALAYNQRVQAFRQLQQAQIQALGTELAANMAQFSQALPGTQVALPSELSLEPLSAPEMTSQFGVSLAGGGTPEQMVQAMNNKLNTIERAITDQNREIQDEVSRQVDARIARLQQNFQEMESLFNQCEGLLAAYNREQDQADQQAIAQHQQQVQQEAERHQEQVGLMEEQCARAEMLAYNPSCGLVEDLAESASGINRQYVGSQRALVGQGSYVCSNYMSQGYQQQMGNETPPQPESLRSIPELCEDLDSEGVRDEMFAYVNSGRNLERMREILAQSMPAFQNIPEANIRGYIMGDNDDETVQAALTEARNFNANTQPIAKYLMGFRSLSTSLNALSADGNADICGSLENFRENRVCRGANPAEGCVREENIDRELRNADGDFETLADVENARREINSNRGGYWRVAQNIYNTSQNYQGQNGLAQMSPEQAAQLRGVGQRIVADCDDFLARSGRHPMNQGDYLNSLMGTRGPAGAHNQ